MTVPPAVSIVICFLDGVRFMAETLDSVARQTLTDFEVLLVDDGSTDGSTALARDWSIRDSRFRYIDHEGHANRGLSASRNVGIRAARAEIVALLDADDVWAPTKLAEQLAILEADTSLAMVCGSTRYWESWSGGTDRILQTGPAPGRYDPPQAAIAIYPLGPTHAPCPSDLMLRRDTVLAIGGFEEEYRSLYEDQVFLSKLYLAAPFVIADRVWLSYRLHRTSIMGATTASNYTETRRRFLVWLRAYLDQNRISAPAVRRRLAWLTLEHDLPAIPQIRRLARRAVKSVQRRLPGLLGF